MQKNNKKASILLWAIMLSLIISITFISISGKINKSIKGNGSISNFNKTRNNENISIQSGINKNIGDEKAIIFEKDKIFSLKKTETFSFSGTNDFKINIGILNGGPIHYKYTLNNNITSSGIIENSESFTGKLDNNNELGKLTFENLGGYTKVLIKSENEFEENKKRYKIINKIGNIYLNKTKGILK